MGVRRIGRIGGLVFASAVAICAVVAGGGYAGAVAATSGSWTTTSDAGDFVGQGQSYSFSTPASGIQFGAMDWGEVRVFADTPNGSWFAFFSAPGGAPLQVGVYDHAQRAADTTHPGLDVSGEGRGCNTTSGSFTVLGVSYGPLGYLQSLHLTFEQHCEGGIPALRGELNLTAPPPPPPLVVHLTVDPTSGYDRSGGSIQLHGTVSCSQPADAAINGQVSEQTKHGTAFAYLRPLHPDLLHHPDPLEDQGHQRAPILPSAAALSNSN